MNMIKQYLLICITLITIVCVPTMARTRTTQAHLRTAEVPIDMIAIDDALLPDSLPAIDPNAISLKGYSKRASDAKESFLVTNNTDHRISAIRLLLRYTTLDGQMINQRAVTIPVSLMPHETRMVAVKTFDIQRMFYYFGGPKPRKKATPFKVAFRLTGYDIPVGN